MRTSTKTTTSTKTRKRTRTKKTKRMRTGSRIAALVIVLAGGLVAQKNDSAHAVVAGTVFRENGFSLAGARVTLIAKGAAKDSKQKPLRSISDARGEFAFRVPPVTGAFLVKADMKGFQSAEKEASV